MMEATLISRPYGPGLIEARIRIRSRAASASISRPYGPGLIEADLRDILAYPQAGDFPALWAGPH